MEIILIVASLAIVVGVCRSTDYPSAEITNGLVRVKLYLPVAKTGFYQGTRFDWSGVIGSLEYSGHNYYRPWFQRTDPKVVDYSYDGADIVAGTCCAMTGTPEEFSTNNKALGFDEAKVGGTFIKIGVGVLRKPDEAAYIIFRQYDLVDGGKWTVRQQADSVEFTQELSDPSTGYAYVYRKTVSLTKGQAQMVLDHSLRNTGERVIQSNVYNHNFLFLDNQAPGPYYTITFPFVIKTAQPPEKALAEIRDNQILFNKILAERDHVQFGIQGYGADAKDYDIRIENQKAGAGVRIRGDRPLARLALWSIKTPLSIEPFINMTIQPGAEFTWKLAYDYYTLPKAGS
jgi:hypothetical protein